MSSKAASSMLSSSSDSSTGSSYRCAAKGICDDKHDLAVRCETADKSPMLRSHKIVKSYASATKDIYLHT